MNNYLSSGRIWDLHNTHFRLDGNVFVILECSSSRILIKLENITCIITKLIFTYPDLAIIVMLGLIKRICGHPQNALFPIPLTRDDVSIIRGLSVEGSCK